LEVESQGFRAGFVAVIGRPNVGKSTLINALLRQKVAAVSPRPQTTRRRQLGILTLPNAQVVLVDTPGLHIPQHQLGEAMNRAAVEALEDMDLILWMVDASVRPTEEDRLVADRLKNLRILPQVLLVLNKQDLIGAEGLSRRQQEYLDLLPSATLLAISAIQAGSLSTLLDAVVERMPEGLPFYDEDQITDLYEREIAVDLIREAALIHLREEVPHAIAVRIEEYTERSETNAYIMATIFVERDSHKAMVIGEGGAMLKKIGTTARKSIEEMSGRKIFLELHVKVRKNWRNDPAALRQFGYSIEDDQ